MGWAEEKKYIYQCAEKFFAKNCDETCKQVDENNYHTYKVNTKNNIVINNFYYGDKLISSFAYDNCKVVDESNWICTTNDKAPETIMTDGRVFYGGSYVLDSFCYK